MVVLGLALGGCVTSSGERLGTTSERLEVCAAGAVVHGIDVSVYQGNIDWADVRDAGIDFAIARVSDGMSQDINFVQNWPAMKAAGVIRGAYQFFEPADDPSAQASLMVQILTEAGGLEASDLPCVADVEVTGGEPAATIAENLKTWAS